MNDLPTKYSATYDATSGFLTLILEGKSNVCNGKTKRGKKTKKGKVWGGRHLTTSRMFSF